MKKFTITGMSCASCSARIEKAVSAIEGVTQCSVNLLTNSMVVDGDVSSQGIINAVEKAGYQAYQNEADVSEFKNNKKELSHDTMNIVSRLCVSVILLIVLMYFSMGQSMWKLPLPSFFADNYIAIALIQLIISAAIMIINQHFFINGFKGLYNRTPNMDTLVAIGSGASFIYSVCVTFLMTNAQANSGLKAVHEYFHDLYFESAAMILVLITVGKMLESYSKGKTTNALKSLMNLVPKTAVVIRQDKEILISASEVKKDDIFIVKPGESIPADGVVIDGNCTVNESALTGESIPVDKSAGDSVSAATISQSGYIRCRALKVGEDTTLSEIIRMVSDAAATKPPIARVADKVSGMFVPFVMITALITVAIWLISGESIGFALTRGISVLVISCPCALGLATPVAIMVANGVGAKNGILFKNASSLETCAKIKVIALDKTGTITAGQPIVTDVITAGEIDENVFMKFAYSLEMKSEHPLSKAIANYACQNGIEPIESQEFMSFAGNGVTAIIDGEELCGGNFQFVSEKAEIKDEFIQISQDLSLQGKTPMFFAKNKVLIGIIAVSDKIKDDSVKAIKEIKSMGIDVVMLTGDNQRTADAVGGIVGIDHIIAGVQPSGKESAVRELKKHGKVAMIGDGINDAPALTTADVGIAIGAGTDIAIDAADIVLTKSRLTDVAAAIRLGRYTLKNIYENLFWAFIYNFIGIPLAAGIWIPAFGWQLNPMFGAAAMSLSSFCVVMNSLRLNFFDIYNQNKIKLIKDKKIMEKTIKIEGMMCAHCEARVKKCLEALDGVDTAEVSFEHGTATVKLSKDISYQTLKETIEAQDYKVVG